MIILGLPCDFCHSPTVSHCPDAGCSWSRCPRCMSYGKPGENFVQWKRDDYTNPYTLLDIKVQQPRRKFPDWLEGMYGTQRNTD